MISCINVLKAIRCLKGKRHLTFLPVRGQRNRTNARTRKIIYLGIDKKGKKKKPSIKNNIFLYNLKNFFFYIFFLIFFFFNLVWVLFDSYEPSFQLIQYVDLFEYSFLFGIDGISIFFIYLSTFLIPLCLLFSFYNMKQKGAKEVSMYQSFLFLTLFLLIFVFYSLDILVFYIMFEII